MVLALRHGKGHGTTKVDDGVHVNRVAVIETDSRLPVTSTERGRYSATTESILTTALFPVRRTNKYRLACRPVTHKDTRCRPCRDGVFLGLQVTSGRGLGQFIGDGDPSPLLGSRSEAV